MLIATIAFATALFSIIHHHPAPISMPARMRAALLIPHAANTLTALHNQHGHASLCPPRQQFDCKLEQSTPVTPLYCHCSLKMYSQNSAAFFTAKFEFSFSKASFTRLQQQAAASSKQQQAASSKQQAAASSSKQQQAAASSSKQQQAAASSRHILQRLPQQMPRACCCRVAC